MKDTLNLAVGERIRSIRELMSLSRESFAELCDISESFLSDIERGKKSLTTKTLYKICTAGNVSPDYIVLGSSENNSDIDTIIEMIRHIDNRHIPYITNILKEYILAINIDKHPSNSSETLPRETTAELSYSSYPEHSH